ncbi:MAG TPA: ECF-type sigma factor [Gemmatimonas sp.]|nr:ECF-type sigma factor [Gemmatimonas sp.]
MKQIDSEGLAGRAAAGAKEGLDHVVQAVYLELRSLARHRLRGAPAEHSLNTTGLVHEAYLRLVDSDTPVQDRDHFLAIASRAMRHVLVDHARARTATKRGGGVELQQLHENVVLGEVDMDKVMELDAALTRLEQLDERQARMVEQRYFGGLTLEEVAAAMDLSLATVKRDLRSARAWLATELGSA